jgi:hypothetical protein
VASDRTELAGNRLLAVGLLKSALPRERYVEIGDSGVWRQTIFTRNGNPTPIALPAWRQLLRTRCDRELVIDHD